MWIDILQVFLGFVIGAVVGFFVSRKLMTKYMKKNPPINEDMISFNEWNGKNAYSKASKSNDEANAKVYVNWKRDNNSNLISRK